MDSDLLRIRRTRIRIPGLKRSYRFLHITDTHLLLYDERETAQRAAYAAPRVVSFAAEGIPTNERFEALWRYIMTHSDPDAQDALDGVLLTGDILDFPSAPNLAFLREHLAALKIPYIFTLGNHDWAYFDDYHTPHSRIANRPLFSDWCQGNTFVHKRRVGELTFVAVDNTMSLYEDGVAEALADALQGEERVLLLQHVPLYVPTLHEDTVSGWGSDLTIGGEGVCQNENWQSVQRLILAEDSPVRAVIAGHLHFWHEDLLGEKLPQYVTAASSDGSATLFTIEG